MFKIIYVDKHVIFYHQSRIKSMRNYGYSSISTFSVSFADLVKHLQWSGQKLDAEHRLTRDRKIVTDNTFIFWL
jgi:hypothetical protein